MSAWWDLALCAPGSGRGYDPDWWTVDGSVLSDENLAAMRICSVCPVRNECWRDNHAIALNQIIAGTWINGQGKVASARGRPATAGVAAP